MRLTTLSLLACLALAPAASAQFILGVNNSGDRVVLLDALDGTLLNANYINLTAAGASISSYEVAVVGSEIWATDMSSDRLLRFSLDGTMWLGNITGAIDGPRGIEVIGGEVWTTNSGTANGAPGNAILRFSPAGASLGFYALGNTAWDMVGLQGDVLVADFNNEDILRYSTAGALIGPFHLSDGVSGIDFPEQLTVRANGNVLAAGFGAPSGIYQYDPSGVQLNFWPITPGLNGVIELGNGNILYSNSNGMHVFDPVAMSSVTVLASVTCRHFTKFAGPSTGTPYCFGDGSGTLCPCSPVPVPHGAAGKGCPTNVFAGGSQASGQGNASIASDTLVLTATDMINGSMIFYQGPTQQSAGAGAVFGDGLRCIQPTSIRRFKTKTVVGNTASYPVGADVKISVAGNVLAPGVRNYQGWYRSANPTFCTADTFNLTNGLAITWGP